MDALRRRLDVGWGQLYHHIHHLKAEGLIRIEADQRRRCIYPTEEADPLGNAQLGAIVRSRTARAIAFSILHKPGRDAQEVASNLNIPYPTLRYHVHRLVEVGLVSRTSRIGYRGLAPTPRLRARLASTTFA